MSLRCTRADFYCSCTQSQDLPPSAVDLMDDLFQFGPSRCPLDPLTSFQALNDTIPFSNRQDQSAHLFDFNQPQFPHSALMPHFIQVFIQNLGAQYPFVVYDDTLERFTSGKLSPLLSNSIASLAVRYAQFFRYAGQYLTLR